jgi:hypothetical protein
VEGGKWHDSMVLIIVTMLAGSGGVVIGTFCAAAGRADEQMEKEMAMAMMTETEIDTNKFNKSNDPESLELPFKPTGADLKSVLYISKPNGKPNGQGGSNDTQKVA